MLPKLLCMAEQQGSTFGEYLLSIRLAKGWSLREAAKHVGLTHSRIDEVERMIDARTGKAFVPSYINVVKFAKAYGLAPDELLKRAGYEPGIELTSREWQIVKLLRQLPEDVQDALIAEVEQRIDGQ